MVRRCVSVISGAFPNIFLARSRLWKWFCTFWNPFERDLFFFWMLFKWVTWSKMFKTSFGRVRTLLVVYGTLEFMFMFSIFKDFNGCFQFQFSCKNGSLSRNTCDLRRSVNETISEFMYMCKFNLAKIPRSSAPFHSFRVARPTSGEHSWSSLMWSLYADRPDNVFWNFAVRKKNKNKN